MLDFRTDRVDEDLRTRRGGTTTSITCLGAGVFARLGVVGGWRIVREEDAIGEDRVREKDGLSGEEVRNTAGEDLTSGVLALAEDAVCDRGGVCS